MGISMFSHWLEDDEDYQRERPRPDTCKECEYRNRPPNPNPNPKNFTIKRIEKIKQFSWVLVNYPDCNTYKGDKILIFKNVSTRRIRLYGTMDPHFSESGLTPVARFRPDPEGVRLSIKFCETC